MGLRVWGEGGTRKRAWIGTDGSNNIHIINELRATSNQASFSSQFSLLCACSPFFICIDEYHGRRLIPTT